jgi:hypothetical protein
LVELGSFVTRSARGCLIHLLIDIKSHFVIPKGSIVNVSKAMALKLVLIAIKGIPMKFHTELQ